MPTFAPNFQYVEDTPHVSGDRGTVALVVRKDSEASIAGTDGDYTLLQVDATGNLRIGGTVLVGNLPAVQPVSDNDGSLTVDGTVSVNNLPVDPIATAWHAGSLPAAATLATVTKTAPGLGKRLVVTGVVASYVQDGALFPAASHRTLILEEAAGPFFQARQAVAASNGVTDHVHLAGLHYVAQDNQPVTLRFDSAGPASTFQSVAMSGYVV